jgi:hypothetical protein
LDELNDQVKKLPTIGRTIDRSRKYRPMENLSEPPNKSRKTGLDRLRKMKNDMFGGKKEQKEGEEMQTQQVRSTNTDRERDKQTKRQRHTDRQRN